MISNNEFDDWGQQSGPQDENPDGNPGGVDLMQVAMRRKGLIALGIFLGLCLGLLYYAQATPIFESVALLSIESQAPPMTSEFGGSYLLQTPAEDHAIRIRTPRIILNALEFSDGKLYDLESLVGQDNPVETVYEGLTVAPVKDGSEVLQLQYRGTNSSDCQLILEQVIYAYENYLEAGQATIADEMKEWIEKAKDEIQEKLRVANEDYGKFRDAHPNLFLLGDDGGRTLEQQKLIDLEQKISEQESQLGNIMASLAVIKRGEETNVDPRALLALSDPSTSNGSSVDAEYEERVLLQERLRVLGQREIQSDGRVIPLRMQLRDLLQRYGKDHPRVRSLEEQIALAEKALEEDQSGFSSVQVADNSKENARERLEILKRSLSAHADRLATLLKKDRQTFNALRGTVSELAIDISKNQEHLNRISRLDSLFEAMVQKVNDVQLLVTAGGDQKVDANRLQEPAQGLRVEPSLAKSLAAGTMLGFLAGFGLGYLVEMFDKTFRSPQEVSKVLQLPMIGHIPEITCEKPAESVLAEVLVTAHKPKSPLAENFRAIRTALYFSTAGQQNHVIQTTSPVPGDGKSTLTANIAITIAQSNKSVLLIDADFRRPTQHKLFGVPNESGLSTLITGETDLTSAAQPTEVTNLHVMGCGPRPHNPSELLTSPQFADLVEMLREQYDFVLIDTPPVLAVTDPGIVSARVDGVIMCLRIRKNGRPSAVRARKVLHDLDANMLGIVVNGIDHRSGSYGYYSSYRRGYGYNYAYKYGYGYGMDKTEKAINKYFEEPKNKAEVKEGAAS